MHRALRICTVIALLLTTAGAVSAMEKFTLIREADLVFVGQMKLSSYFLSFDGLHVNGNIAATEILYGSGHVGSEFPYHQVIPCTLWNGCDYRGMWANWSNIKELLTRTPMIWALVRGQASSWTSSYPAMGPAYDINDREKLIEVVNERNRLDRQKR